MGMLKSEAGVTLVELLVGLIISLIVFAATVGLLVSSMHRQTSVGTRIDQLVQAQLGAARLVRELRQASGVTLLSATQLAYTEPTRTGTASISLSCSSTTLTCVETTGSVNTTVITNVANTDIFTASPSNTSPNYIGIKLVIAATGHTTTTVTDGVALRNVALGG